ncbi:MAG: rRNA cytosine-C5-methyltransferase, partial [Bacteroidales bacterium]|nr:rRNA cytosine-C5-methyltransferase [Bacteroidales bacterium]
LKYLSKENILLPDSPSGIILLTYRNLPLGFCKNLGNRVNNLYPKNFAIRVNLS